jgi:hypothetical protein
VNGIVASGVRVAEVGEHAVALELGDMPVEALDHVCAGGVVGGDQLAEVLGVEPPPERRRPDEVAEDDRQLTALDPCSSTVWPQETPPGWGPAPPGVEVCVADRDSVKPQSAEGS